MANEAMSADSFKKNFIESYVGNVQGLDTEEKKNITNLRRKEAENLADEVIKVTQDTLKANGISEYDFAFSVLNSKLDREGYTKLVSSGNKANIESINGILKKEIDNHIEVQRRQAEEQVKDSFSEEKNEKERLNEEEVKKQLEQIDFDNLSIDDMIFIGENLETALGNMSAEETSSLADVLAAGQDQEIKKATNKKLLLMQKIVKGEEITQEEHKVITEEFNCETPEEFFDKYGNSINEIVKIAKAIEAKLDKNDGVLSEEDTQNIIKNINSEVKMKEAFESLGFNIKNYIDGIVDIQNKEHKQKTDINGEVLKDYQDTEEVANIDFSGELNKSDIAESFDFSRGFEDFGEEVNFDINPEDVTPEILENVTNVMFENQRDPAQIVQEIEITEEPTQEQKNIVHDNIEPEDLTEIEQVETLEKTIETNEEQLAEQNKIIEETQTYKSPEIEKKTWRERLAESKNPVLKAFSRIFNRTTREALPPSEGTLKAKDFDDENKEIMGLSEARDGVLSPLKAIRNQINKSMGKVFGTNQRKTASDEIINSTGLIENIQKGNQEDGKKPWEVSADVRDAINHPERLIPQPKDIENARTLEGKKADRGWTLDK